MRPNFLVIVGAAIVLAVVYMLHLLFRISALETENAHLRLPQKG